MASVLATAAFVGIAAAVPAISLSPLLRRLERQLVSLPSPPGLVGPILTDWQGVTIALGSAAVR